LGLRSLGIAAPVLVLGYVPLDGLEQAVAAVIAGGEAKTYDMGGNASTLDVANAIAAKL
jgi:isocitrate/isopropylmalate dehydrogenase